ncbi:hypothetical protein GQ54DRAFT_312351 [Martensiomyces pterosporus]|nr:hypothetical protein GQ54DRAFT_312351 [Martensiomyces pterosporus]
MTSHQANPSKKDKHEAHASTKYDKWTRDEGKKMLSYLCQPENLRIFLYNKNYCYNKLSEHILRERSATQIKNKLASLETRYKKARRQLENWLDARSVSFADLTPDQAREAYECFDPPVPEYPQLHTIFSAKPTRLRAILPSSDSQQTIPADSGSLAMHSQKRKFSKVDQGSHLGHLPHGFNPNVYRRTDSSIRYIPHSSFQAGTGAGNGPHGGLPATSDHQQHQLPLMPPSISAETTVTTEGSLDSSKVPSSEGSASGAPAEPFVSPAPPDPLSPRSTWCRDGLIGSGRNNNLHPHDARRNSISAIVHTPATIGGSSNTSSPPLSHQHLFQTLSPQLARHYLSGASSTSSNGSQSELVSLLSNHPLTAEEIALHNRELALREREQEHQHKLDMMRQQREYEISKAQIELRQRELAVREREANIAYYKLGITPPQPQQQQPQAAVDTQEQNLVGGSGKSNTTHLHSHSHARRLSFQASTSTATPQISVTAPLAQGLQTPTATVHNGSYSGNSAGRDLLALPSDDLLKYKTTAAPEDGNSSHMSPTPIHDSPTRINLHSYVVSPALPTARSGYASSVCSAFSGGKRNDSEDISRLFRHRSVSNPFSTSAERPAFTSKLTESLVQTSSVRSSQQHK